MTRAARKASLLVAFYLLTSAATAAAECAWVLWEQTNTGLAPLAWPSASVTGSPLGSDVRGPPHHRGQPGPASIERRAEHKEALARSVDVKTGPPRGQA